jgi:type I restriction enzyme, S subunit
MIAELKPYPDYKESGLQWLGLVPKDWSIRRIKTVLRETDLRSVDGTDTLLSLTRVRGLIPHKDMTDKMHSAKTLVGYKHYRPGQIVMNRMQAWSGMFGAGSINGLVSPDYAVFDVLGGNQIRLILERLKTPDLVGQFALESKGIGSGFNRLYTDRFGPIPLSLPPIDEQAAIVRFLDHANRRLEKAIRAKRKVIALLNEQKQAIIHRAVTHGLDPSVHLKPSGIPWLGDIPQHWEVLALKRVLRRLIDCEHKTAPQVDQSDFRVVRTTGVRYGALHMHGTYCTSARAFQAWTRRGLPESGDVVFTREAPAGEACIVPAGINICLGQRTVLMRLNQQRLNSQFLVHKSLS